MHKTTVLCLLLAACAFALPAAAASRLGNSCDLSVVGATDTAGFYHFDNALREAVTARDATALAALVEYPIRLNYAKGGHVEVGNAATLQGRYADLLWPLLRKAVDGQQPGDLFCNAEGVMYGDGAVWANPDGHGHFHVTALNLPGSAPAQHAAASAAQAPAAAGYRTLLTCDTNKFHIVIDAAADEQPRYRSWNTANLPPAPPAMNLVGQARSEGSGMCRHREWRFRNGNTDYVVSEPGCTTGEVPANAKARLEVAINGKTQLDSWCH